MGVILERLTWEPNASLFVILVLFILLLLALSCTNYPLSSSSPPSAICYGNGRHESSTGKGKSHSPFDFSTAAPSRFHRHFLLIYSLAAVMEGMWSVIGEFEFDYFRISKEDIMSSLCLGHAASLLIGTFFGVLSDLVGHNKICLLFFIIHLIVSTWKRITGHPSVWFTTACLSFATSIFSSSFEAWLVVEHEVQSYRHDVLTETFLLMTFLQSVMSVGSQFLVNGLLGSNIKRGNSSFSTVAIFLSTIGIAYHIQRKKQDSRIKTIYNYKLSFLRLLKDKRVWLLGLSHTCLHFAVAVVWLLWAPTLVADGREVNLGLIFPCLMGARMLGCTVFQYLLSCSSPPGTENFVSLAFVLAGLSLSVIAYDYQEIGFLVFLFSLFHVSEGLILPSLARLRSIYVPKELRGGMLSVSLAPARAAMLFLLVQRGYFGNLENSTMLSLAALGLFVAAAGIHFLKGIGKQIYHTSYKVTLSS